MHTVLVLGMLRVPQVTRLSSQSKALAQLSPGEDLGERLEAKRTERMGSELPGKAKHCCLSACVNFLWR